MSRRTKIPFKPIKLRWSEWYTWAQVKEEIRSSSSIDIPSSNGVYEARKRRVKRRLTIGKTNNLRRRIRLGLVRGSAPHSSGKKIRAYENVKDVRIRWATTNRPAAVEEELHRRHIRKHGTLPKYTEKT